MVPQCGYVGGPRGAFLLAGGVHDVILYQDNRSPLRAGNFRGRVDLQFVISDAILVYVLTRHIFWHIIWIPS